MANSVGMIGSGVAYVDVSKDGIKLSITKVEPLTIQESAEIRRNLERAETEAFLLQPRSKT